MSSQILPIQGQSSHPSTSSVIPAASAGEDLAFSSPLAGEHTISVQAIRGGPPAEVLDQMASAGLANERLRDEGYQLGFRTDEQTGRVVIELQDLSGATLRHVSAAEALDIVAGKQPS